MSGEFTEVRGTAHDLQAWHAPLTGDAAPFQRIEAAKEPTAFTGRFWRVVLDQVSMNLIEIGVLLPAVPADVRRDAAGVAGAGRGALVD